MRGQSDTGFVFPYVLGFIALLAAISAALVMLSQNLAARQALIGDQIEFEFATESAMSRVLFARMTGEAVSSQGLANCLEREEQSLIVPTTLGRVGIDLMLADRDVSVDGGRLMAVLRDYIDSDDAIALQGAEAPAYADRGRLPPPNDSLRHSLEIKAVLDWDVFEAVLGEGVFENEFTIHGGPTFHLGDASALAMASRLEMSLQDAVRLRQFIDETGEARGRIGSEEDLVQSFGGRVPVGGLLVGRTQFFSLIFWDDGFNFAERRVIHVMPNGILEPYAVRERIEFDEAARLRLRELIDEEMARSRWACSGAP
jgi:hypothetical protein